MQQQPDKLVEFAHGENKALDALSWVANKAH